MAPTIPYPVLALASTPSHVLLASSSSLHLVNPALPSSSASTSTALSPTSIIRNLAVSDNGKLAVTSSEDKTLVVWDIGESLTVKSTRKTVKKVACLSFAPDGSILLTDKTGDVYSYPLEPREIVGEPIQSFVLQTDPTQNPEADLLLGHVSVIASHLVTPDGKHIITADRDEHIRVSRYPQSYVIERFMFLPEGFTSAIHIPASHPSLLLSAGGEPSLCVWDWTTGTLLSSLDIWPSILPHRRVRTAPRKQKKRKQPVSKFAPSDDPTNEAWYVAPEGFIMPHGQGVCVQAIDSVQVGDETVVLFFSQGAAAVHAFAMKDLADVSTAQIHTLPVSHPVLGFTPVPHQPGRFLVALDTAWGVLKNNAIYASKPTAPELSEAQVHDLGQLLITVQLGAGGSIEAVPDSPLSSFLNETVVSVPTVAAEPVTVAGLNLYSDLTLYPRWLGMEEDDEDAAAGGGTPAPATPTEGVASPSASAVGSGEEKKVPTAEEMSKMGVRALGRLKSQGVDVGGHLLSRKKRKLIAKQAREEEAEARGEETEKSVVEEGEAESAEK